MFTAVNTELSVRSAELMGMTEVLGCVENPRPPAPGTSQERPRSAMSCALQWSRCSTRAVDGTSSTIPVGKSRGSAWHRTHQRVLAEDASPGLL